MAVPTFQQLMLPMLKLAGDGKVWSLRDARERLAEQFHLSADDLEERVPSGRQTRFANRVAWAKVYLQRAELLSSPRRAHFCITDEGRSLLSNPPKEITIRFLQRYPNFQHFRSSSSQSSGVVTDFAADNESRTPEEIMASAYREARDGLAAELLQRVKDCSPTFFEQLVVDLLLAMGYGRMGAGERVGCSGDEGIDGIISEDRLGLEMVYLQAKRWKGTVGRPEIQKFVGALHGRRARKGVFITTGCFSSEACEYVESIEPNVVLIDGEQLVEYMIDFDLGVSSEQTYTLKRLDTDYFED